MASRVLEEPIQVAIRARPSLERERGVDTAVQFYSSHITLTDPITRTFTDFPFSTNFLAEGDSKGITNNEYVYTNYCKKATDSAIKGINSSILFLGAGCTGKSHSMFGVESDPGMLPRIMSDLPGRLPASDIISLSMYSISNNHISDMMCPLSITNPPTGLSMDSIPDGNFPVVDGLREVILESSDLKTNDIIVRTVLANTCLHELAVGLIAQPKSYISQITIKRNNVTYAQIFLVELTAIDTLYSVEKRDMLTNTHDINDRYTRKIPPARELVEFDQYATCLLKGERPQFVPGKLSLILKHMLLGNTRTLVLGTISPSGRKYNISKYTLQLIAKLQRGKNKVLRFPYSHIHTTPSTVAVSEENTAMKRSEDYKTTLEHYISSINEQFVTLGLDPERLAISTLPVQQRDDVIKMHEEREQYQKHLIRMNLSGDDIKTNSKASFEKLLKDLYCVRDINNTEKLRSHGKLLVLHNDTLLSGMGAFQLHGEKWTINRKGKHGPHSFIVNGLQMQLEHCTIQLVNGEYVIVVNPNSRVIVNGMIINESYTLNHGDRIVLGANTCFIFIKHDTVDTTTGITSQYLVTEDDFANLSLVSKEATKSQLGVVFVGTTSDVGYWKKDNEYAKIISGNPQVSNGTGCGTGYDYTLYELYRSSIWDMMNIGNPEDKLRSALRETELTMMIPRVGEANAICMEMSQYQLNIVVKVNQYNEDNDDDDEAVAASTKTIEDDKYLDSTQKELLTQDLKLKQEEKERRRKQDSGVIAYITNNDNQINVKCTLIELSTLLYEFREMYNLYIITGDPSLPQNEDKNPFYVTPHGPQLVGTARVYLQPLYYLLAIPERSLPIIDHKGDCVAKLELNVYPQAPELWELLDEEEEKEREQLNQDPSAIKAATTMGGTRDDLEVYFDEGDITEFENKHIRIFLKFKRVIGLSKQYTKDVYVKFKWPLNNEIIQSDPCNITSVNPKLDYTHVIDIPSISKEQIQQLHDAVVEIQVYGYYPRSVDTLKTDPTWQRLLSAIDQFEARVLRTEFDIQDSVNQRNGIETDDDKVYEGRKKQLEDLSIQLSNATPDEIISKIQYTYEQKCIFQKQNYSLENELYDNSIEIQKLREAYMKIESKLKSEKEKKKVRQDIGEEIDALTAKYEAEMASRTAQFNVDKERILLEKESLNVQLIDMKKSYNKEKLENELLLKQLNDLQEQMAVLHSEMSSNANNSEQANDAQVNMLTVQLRQKTDALEQNEAKLRELNTELSDVKIQLEQQKAMYESRLQEKDTETDEQIRKLVDALDKANTKLATQSRRASNTAGTTGGAGTDGRKSSIRQRLEQRSSAQGTRSKTEDIVVLEPKKGKSLKKSSVPVESGEDSPVASAPPAVAATPSSKASKQESSTNVKPSKKAQAQTTPIAAAAATPTSKTSTSKSKSKQSTSESNSKSCAIM